MADNKSFTLVGKFDDQITPKLRDINKQIAELTKSFTNVTKVVTTQTTEVKKLTDILEQLNKSFIATTKSAKETSESFKKFDGSSSGVKKTGEEVDELGKKTKRAKEESEGLLHTLLKFEAIKKVGEGFSEGMMEGAHKTVEILQKGMEFMGERFKDAIEDEGEEVASQMQYYAQIKQKGFFGDTSKLTGIKGDLQNIQNVNIGREQYELGESTVQKYAQGMAVNQDTLTATFRALAPYTTPDILKREGVTGKTRAGALAKAMTEDKDPLTGKTFEQTMGPGMVALTQLATAQGPANTGRVIREVQEYVESGMMKSQAMAWQNPVFRAQAKALTAKFEAEGMDANAARARAALEAAQMAVPMEAMNIASQTVQAGLGSLNQSILSAKTGLLSLNKAAIRSTDFATGKEYGYGFGARAAAGGAGVKLDENMIPIMSTVKKTSAYAIHMKEITDHYGPLIAAQKQGTAAYMMLLDNQKKDVAELNQRYVAIHSPMDAITAELGPLLQKIAKLFSSADNVFISPVMAMMDKLGPAMATLDVTLDGLSKQVQLFYQTAGKKGKSLPEALGQAMGSLFKAIASMFDPKMTKGANTAVDKFFAEFTKGFSKDVDGPKYMKIIMDGLTTMITHLLFQNGNVLKPTAITKALLGLTAVFAAPVVIGAVISGVTPLIIESMIEGFTGMVDGIIAKAGANVAANVAKEAAAKAAASTAVEGGGAAVAEGAAGAAAAAEGGGALAATAEGAEVAATTLGGAAIAVPAAAAALAAAVVIFQKPLIAFGKWLENAGAYWGKSKNLLMKGIGQFTKGVGQFVQGITNIFAGTWELLKAIFSGNKAKTSAALDRIGKGIVQLFSAIGNEIMGLVKMIPGAIVAVGGALYKLGTVVNTAIITLGSAIADKLIGLVKNIHMPNIQLPSFGGGKARRKWDGKGNEMMPIHSAIASEMANKPPGSDLVIANSSETIIPAATGLNTGGFSDGFTMVASAIREAANKTTHTFEQGFFKLSNRLHQNHLQQTQTLNHVTQISHQQHAALMSAISSASAGAAAGGMAGGAGGAGGAGAAGFFAGMAGGKGAGKSGMVIAGQLGDYIKATGGAPGSIHEHPWHGGVRGRHAPRSYHKDGRAIDIGAYAYEQGGVLARIAQFNAKMGVRPVELLKAGDPGHSDHVHVAYAMGLGNPAYFPTQSDAMEWEGKMMPPGASVRSVTSNTSEGLGGAVTVNAPITIHQQPGQDAEQLASIVAIRLNEAIMQARSSSIQY